MRDARTRKQRPPLDAARLNELALSYVGRFATTRAKLRAYLERKVRERGWDGEAPDLAALAEQFAQRGYVDDEAFALAKARSLTRRGYGARRIEQSLRAAGVEDDDSAGARSHAEVNHIAAALRFAERRRLGPFATEPADRSSRERAIAAMVRAGHPFAVARRIAELPHGVPVDGLALASDPNQ